MLMIKVKLKILKLVNLSASFLIMSVAYSGAEFELATLHYFFST